MAWGGYKTKRWRRLRMSILRRDKARCREWARYGKTVEATTVHHVWPAEDYPEYAWSPGTWSACPARSTTLCTTVGPAS